MNKIVYSFDALTGQFIGALTLTESDMSPLEPGVWHIPAHCLEIAPPDAPEGMYAAEVDGQWVLKEFLIEPSVEEAPAFSAEAREANLKERMEALEYAAQVHLDSIAVAHRFSNIADACSYANDPTVPKYWAQGRAFLKLRAHTFLLIESLVDLVLAGEAEEPTHDQMLVLLPLLDTMTAEKEQAELESARAALENAPAEADEPVAKPKKKGK